MVKVSPGYNYNGHNCNNGLILNTLRANRRPIVGRQKKEESQKSVIYFSKSRKKNNAPLLTYYFILTRLNNWLLIYISVHCFLISINIIFIWATRFKNPAQFEIRYRSFYIRIFLKAMLLRYTTCHIKMSSTPLINWINLCAQSNKIL